MNYNPPPVKRSSWPLWKIVVLVAAALVLTVLVGLGSLTYQYKLWPFAPAATTTQAPTEPPSAPLVWPTATLASNTPVPVPATGTPETNLLSPASSTSKTDNFVWDQTFGGASQFYANADGDVVNYYIEGMEMSYTCTQPYGIFLVSDPGVFAGISSGKLAYAAFAPCEKDKVIKFSTDSYNSEGDPQHQQIHLIEVRRALPSSLNYRDMLLALKAADAKPVAYFMASDGTYETITDDPLWALQAMDAARQPPDLTNWKWDNSFHGADIFYVDGDLHVANFKARGAQMSYTCTNDLGVFISMDAGNLLGQTAPKGAYYVDCGKAGDIIDLSTNSWNEASLHNNVHLVPLVFSLPESVPVKDLLISLAKAEGRPAYMIGADGSLEKVYP